MSIKLIFNADDYGRTTEVSRGIRDAHLNGLVTSTTCMMNLADTANDIRIALDLTPALGLGVHLTLTADSPILPPAKIPTLCDASGKFLKLNQFLARLNTIDISEVKAEWRAQIEAFVNAAKRKPTHLDSHHHSSYFSPALFRAMLELAREFDCAVRLPVVDKTGFVVTGLPEEVTANIQKEIAALAREFSPRTPDGFFADFYDEHATKDEILNFVAPLRGGTYEIMCHPGYNDDHLLSISSYNSQRERELAVLSSSVLREKITNPLVNFNSM